MNVDIVDKYCTDDNNPIKKPTLEEIHNLFFFILKKLEIIRISKLSSEHPIKNSQKGENFLVNNIVCSFVNKYMETFIHVHVQRTRCIQNQSEKC
jgi:hypothetical protein